MPKRLNRRGVLQSGGLLTVIGLAGCTGDGSEDVSENESDTETESDTTDDSPTGNDSNGEKTDGETPREHPNTIYVGPDGSKTNPGTRAEPIASIQQALDQAQPGETVSVKTGEYVETFRTRRSGTPEDPIIITGPRDAILRPPKDELDGRMFDINHNHIHLKGMTFDGLADPNQPTDPGQYVDSIIECRPVNWAEYTAEYLTDVKVMPRALGNCRRVMIQHIRTNQFEAGSFRVIGPAGVQTLYGDVPEHIGEVVYLGTAPDNINDEWYQWDGPDNSHDIHIHHIDNSAGHPHAELVDVKAGCYNVLIEYCTDGGGAGRYVLEGNSTTSETAFHIGGRQSTLRWCVVENSNGQVVEVASWGVAHPEAFEREKGLQYPTELFDHGRANSIYGNRFKDSAGLAIRYPIIYPEDGEPHIAEGYGPDEQAHVCGNDVTGPTHGTPEAACPSDIPKGDGIGHTGGQSPWS
jgi:hypothetical protein